MNKKIAIIGGGAAGMMAAARINEVNSDANIVLFEKNAVLGRKVVISGGGRCNVTTGIQDVRELLKRYTRGSKFLTSAMWNFPPASVYEWFEAHGVPLKTESDMRVFPQSNDGNEIVNVFIELFAETNVDVRLKTAVREVVQSKDTAEKFIVRTDQGEELFDAIIITTGGQAYRHTGSTGDGYAFAEALGHTITPLAASLNSFIIAEEWTHQVPGVSFTDILMTGKDNSSHTARGPVVFTHKGMSGPAVFALSSLIAFEDYTKDKPYSLYIDWLPQVSEQSLRESINNACGAYPKKQLVLLLKEWMPKSVAMQLLQSTKIDESTLLAAVSKQMRTNIIHLLKSSLVHITGRSAGSEFVTAGGVETNEIDSGTMQSQITPGLFFAGEIMNVDGVTGGFNLQASWAAGRLAGESASVATE